MFEDIFWPISTWPAYMLSILLDADFGYQDRLSFAGFFVGNGLIDPEIPVKIYKFYNQYWSDTRDWRQRFLKFENLFEYLNKAYKSDDPECDSIKTKYYYYSMHVNHMMYFDGDLRLHGGERKKYVPAYP